MLGGGGIGERGQAAVVGDLVQAHVVQDQARATAGLQLLIAALGIEEGIAFARPYARIAGRAEAAAPLGADLDVVGLALAPRAQRFAAEHHHRGHQRQRDCHRNAQPLARQAQRTQRGQFRGGGQLAQPHQRADHGGGREEGVGTAGHGVQHPGGGVAKGIAALADILELAGEGHHHVQADQHRPGQQDGAEHGTAQVQIKPHGAQHVHAVLRGRDSLPSRKYIHRARPSSGRVSHHRPATAGILPSAIQRVPMNIRFMPTM